MHHSSRRRARAVWTALIAAALCSLPASAQRGPGRERPCPEGADCLITVTVDANCGITVDPDVASTRAAHRIRWRAQGGEFTDNGIEFDHPQFERQPRERRDEFIYFNQKQAGGDFKYRVTVEGCPTLDPTIRNF